MSVHPVPSWPQALDDARRTLALIEAHGKKGLPGFSVGVGERDQLAAACAETVGWLHEYGALLEVRERDIACDHEAAVYFVAAMSRCESCRHIKARPLAARPVVVVLGIRRALCQRCAWTLSQSAFDLYGRTCDFCWAEPVERFLPVTAALGALFVHGDACDACAHAMKAGSSCEREERP